MASLSIWAMAHGKQQHTLQQRSHGVSFMPIFSTSDLLSDSALIWIRVLALNNSAEVKIIMGQMLLGTSFSLSIRNANAIPLQLRCSTLPGSRCCSCILLRCSSRIFWCSILHVFLMEFLLTLGGPGRPRWGGAYVGAVGVVEGMDS